MVDVNVPLGLAQLNKLSLAILRLDKGGQCEDLGLMVGMQLTHIAKMRVKTLEAFEEALEQLMEDDLDEKVPLDYQVSSSWEAPASRAGARKVAASASRAGGFAAAALLRGPTPLRTPTHAAMAPPPRRRRRPSSDRTTARTRPQRRKCPSSMRTAWSRRLPELCSPRPREPFSSASSTSE